ncbi:MAG: DNA gyrase modulator, partial [Acidimicrobiales bacterium]
MTTVELDAEFLALPLEAVRGAALERARVLGCEHAEVRVERIRSQVVKMRDARLETSADHVELGIGIRVVHEGSFGFAATVELAPGAAAALAEEAVATARATALAVKERVELAEEPSHGEAVWTSAYRLDPAEVPMADKVAVLEDWSGRLLASSAVDHVTAFVLAVVEDKHYANLSGTVTTQRRVRVNPVVETVAVDAESAGFETMRSVAPPAGRGWEYLLGEGWDWDEELARLPEYLAEKLHAPSVVPGSYDLVIDPSNLWLVIHESIGHATEL